MVKFPRSETLYNFDIYPKVLVVGKEATLHLVNNGYRKEFTPGEEYKIKIVGYKGGAPERSPKTADAGEISAICDEKGGFTFKYTFNTETEYRVVAEKFEDGKCTYRVTLSVYAVEEDLKGRYPFMGDLHMHTTESDGRQTPEVVAATYRSIGYDFLAITDHEVYYPSLQAIDFYKDIPTEFNLVPGEEVHLPACKGSKPFVHIVNFGGEYSVNGLVEGEQTDLKGKDKKYRAVCEDCPDVMTKKEYENLMEKLSKEIDAPDNLDAVELATYKWIFDNIRKGNGLGIFAHPTWVTGNAFHVPDVLNDYFVEHKLFDAFEVIGGESYYEQNGFQTVRYYEDKAKGYRYPIVGSTDSHCCYDYNEDAYICATIVFSPENERTSLIKSIKDFYSCAVDTISREFRVIGDMRFVRYASFLLKNYFPIHDEACYEEGRLMKQCAIGTEEEKEEAIKTLATMNGRIKKLREKYFDF